MSPMEQALDALGRGQGAWTKDTAQNLADLIAAKDARIERLEAALRGAQEALGEGEWIAASDILFDALAGKGG